MTPEGAVKNRVKELLKGFGVWFYMPVSMGMGQHGIPDFVCCINGFFLGIECKADATKKPTQLQKLQMAAIRAAGGITMVIHNENLHELTAVLVAMANAHPSQEIHFEQDN